MNLSDIQWWLIGLTFLLAAVYQLIIKYWTHFSRNGVKFIRGLPILGTHYKVLFCKQNLVVSYRRLYNEFPNEAFIGFYEMGGSPSYLIRDPELIKQLAIKDFDHFVDHKIAIDHNIDPLFGRTMFVMRGQKWQKMRATLSPAFTSSKMRLMCSLLSECAEQICNELKKEVGTQGHPKEYNLSDLFKRFANDAIATSAFGVQLNSMAEKDNEFFKTGSVIANFDGVQGLKMLGFQSVPRLMSWLKIRFFTSKHTKYFRDLVHGNMNFREKNKIIRHDMIHLLMEARKGNLTHISNEPQSTQEIGFATVQESDVGKSSRKITQWHDDDFVAQCITFFLAGFNALSLSPSFLVHELVVNPDIQQRLFVEIQEAQRQLNGKSFTFDVLQNMKYLDQVLSEALRRWTLAVVTDRSVNKPYVLESSDGSKVQLNVGDGIWFPLDAIHMDPKYYPNPEVFDPERFSDRNKGRIQSGTYFPFGVGPRNCIGSRFALMGVKAIVYHLILNFQLEMSEHTQHPLKLLNGPSANLIPEKGLWANFKAR